MKCKLLLFHCVVISDLYLLQYNFFFKPLFQVLWKNNIIIYWYCYQNLVLVIVKFTAVVLRPSSVNTKHFVHGKSSSNSQLTKNRHSDPKKVLRYFKGGDIPTFKVGAGCCRGWLMSPYFSCCGLFFWCFSCYVCCFVIFVISPLLSPSISSL